MQNFIGHEHNVRRDGAALSCNVSLVRREFLDQHVCEVRGETELVNDTGSKSSVIYWLQCSIESGL